MTAKSTSKKKVSKKKRKSGSGARSKKKKSVSRRKTAAASKTSRKKAPAKKAKTAKAGRAKKTPTAGRRVGGAKTKKRKKTTTKSSTRRKRRQPRLDLDAFRARLTGIHAELVQSYLSAKGNSRSRESDGTEDYIDYAVSSYDREFLLSLTELEQQRLKLVDEALRRLDRGEYGLCVQCERPIRPKRLEVQPWARYCVRCQELADRGGIGDSGDLPEEDEEDLDDGEFEDEEFEEAEEDEVDSDEEELIES